MAGTTTTRRTIRRELYDRIPFLGFYGTADSVAAGSITDTFVFQDSNLSADQYRGAYVYRPDRTGDDRIKKAGQVTIATGVLAHTGSNYSNTTDTNYEIVGFLHPDELDNCIIRAMRKVYFETQSNLTLITDGDMSTSGVGSWTTIGTLATKEKVTTASSGVHSGIQALHTVNGDTNSGVASASVSVHPDDPIFVSVVLRVETNSGATATVTLYDATNSATIGSYSTTREGWTRIWIQENAPSTCELVSVRLTCAENNAEVFWDHVTLIRLYDRRVFAPSWLNEPHKFLKLRQARYTHNLDDHVDDPNSRDFMDWYQPQMYSLDAFHPEANAYAIQLQRSHPSADLWIEAKRPYYDIEPLSSDTGTTTAPFDLAVAQSMVEVSEILVRRYPTDPRWPSLLAEANQRVKEETQSRPEIPFQPLQQPLLGRI